MSKLSSNMISAAKQFAVNNDTHADAVGDAYIDEILWPGRFPALQPEKRQGACAARVFDLYRQASCGCQLIAQVDSSPSQGWCIQNSSGALIYHTRHGEPDALDTGCDRMGFYQPADASREVTNKLRYRKYGVVSFERELSP